MESLTLSGIKSEIYLIADVREIPVLSHLGEVISSHCLCLALWKSLFHSCLCLGQFLWVQAVILHGGDDKTLRLDKYDSFAYEMPGIFMLILAAQTCHWSMWYTAGCCSSNASGRPKPIWVSSSPISSPWLRWLLPSCSKHPCLCLCYGKGSDSSVCYALASPEHAHQILSCRQTHSRRLKKPLLLIEVHGLERTRSLVSQALILKDLQGCTMTLSLPREGYTPISHFLYALKQGTTVIRSSPPWNFPACWDDCSGMISYIGQCRKEGFF